MRRSVLGYGGASLHRIAREAAVTPCAPIVEQLHPLSALAQPLATLLAHKVRERLLKDPTPPLAPLRRGK